MCWPVADIAVIAHRRGLAPGVWRRKLAVRIQNLPGWLAA